LTNQQAAFQTRVCRVPPSPLRIEGDGIFVSKMNSFDTTRLPDHRGRTAGQQVQHLCGAYTEIPIWATSAHLAVRWWPPREPPRAHSWPLARQAPLYGAPTTVCQVSRHCTTGTNWSTASWAGRVSEPLAGALPPPVADCGTLGGRRSWPSERLVGL